MAKSTQNVMLDALKYKIRQAKDELERYKDDYEECQQLLARELDHRASSEAECQRQQRRSAALEAELQQAWQQLEQEKATLREARAALGESERLRQVLEHRDLLQKEKIELLNWRLTKVLRHSADCDETAQQSVKRTASLSERLESCEQQLAATLASNATLQAELSAAGKNVHCVEHAAELSARGKAAAEQQLDQLQRRLSESERRARCAEVSVEQLQLAAEQLEQQWREKLRRLGFRS